MLRSLRISNFALIDQTDLLLGKGLNILTGETGAGKSLLLGAIGLILGRRVDYGMIFHPEKKCVVEAVFQNLPAGTMAELKRKEEFDWEDDLLVIRREASSDGKSRAFINDTPVTLQLLKEVTGVLVDLHGQHQNQMLTDSDFQLRLLDQYAGTTLESNDFSKKLSALGHIHRQIENLEKEDAAARNQQDYFRSVVEELMAAGLSVEEEARLEAELRVLEHAGEIKETLAFVIGSLFEEETSAYGQMSEAIGRLDRISKFNHGIGEHQRSLVEARILLQDAVAELVSISDSIDLDPGALQAMQERADFLQRLKKKFSVQNIGGLIAMRDDYRSRLEHDESLGEQIETLRVELGKAKKIVLEAGLALEEHRKKGVGTLNSSVDELLNQVGLQNAKFEVEVLRNEDAHGILELDGMRIQPNPTGINQVEFRIRTNAGMPMGTLGQIASGGEVSRVMLAIKAALAEKAELSVLIFDEIDTGISGEIA
ncbi:MAG: hypothetical protein RLZZ165_2100, partial [Bacteroidota bacterium]